MNDQNNLQGTIDRCSAMSTRELSNIATVCKLLGVVIAFLGIGMLMLIMYMPTTSVILSGAILVFVFARTSGGLSTIRSVIDLILLERAASDK
jgi:hypothetical protein